LSQGSLAPTCEVDLPRLGTAWSISIRSSTDYADFHRLVCSAKMAKNMFYIKTNRRKSA
jgi:hypothetical protein